MVRLATSNSDRRVKQIASHAIHNKASEQVSGDQDSRFSLVHALQTSLEIDKILEIFFASLQEFITASAITYRFADGSTELVFGSDEAHSISYSLSSEDSSLGELIFHRQKPFMESELAVLEMLIGVLHHPLKNALLYREAIAFSMRDALTGVGNRSAMDACFARELKLAQRQPHTFSVLVVDLDHFKEVNDSMGHKNGDLVLKHVVGVMRETLRDTDQIFRFGGEEFVVLINHAGLKESETICERIREDIAATAVKLEQKQYFCTVSIGATTFTGSESAEILFERADSALYQAKKAGRNQIALWQNLKNDKHD